MRSNGRIVPTNRNIEAPARNGQRRSGRAPTRSALPAPLAASRGRCASETSSAATLRSPASGKRSATRCSSVSAVSMISRGSSGGRQDARGRAWRAMLNSGRARWPARRTGSAPGVPAIRQSATKATIETTGTKSAAAMMPGLSMSCSRLTLSATFDHSDISTTSQNATAHIWPARAVFRNQREAVEQECLDDGEQQPGKKIGRAADAAREAEEQPEKPVFFRQEDPVRICWRLACPRGCRSSTRSQIAPMNGTSPISVHQPDLSRSCQRLA